MRLSVPLLAIALFAYAPLAAMAQAPTITSATATQTPNTLHYLVDVQGTGFISGNSVVYINGAAQTTTYVSSTEVKVPVYTAAKGTTSVTAQVEQSSGNSNSEPVTIPFAKVRVVGLDAQGQIDTTNANPFDSSMAQLNDHASGYPGVWTTAIIGVGWNQLQADSQNETINTSAIETALSNIASYNTANGTNVTAKIRVFAGTHTPSWAMTLGGGPVSVMDSAGNYQNFPAFWSSAYRTAFNNMVQQLAETYDMDPRIQEVAITSCSSKTGEPFIYNSSDWTSVQNMHTAGFTDAQMESCLTNAYTDYSTYWTHTPIDYTMNVYNATDGFTSSGGSSTPNKDYSMILMSNFRYALGSQGVIANHDLADPPPGGTVIYFGETSGSYTGTNGYGMQAEGAPTAFQSYSASTPTGGWDNTFFWGACQFGLTEFELFPSTRTTVGTHLATYTTTDLNNWSTWLAGGVPGSLPSGSCTGF